MDETAKLDEIQKYSSITETIEVQLNNKKNKSVKFESKKHPTTTIGVDTRKSAPIPTLRIDAFGQKITKDNKAYKVSFIDNLGKNKLTEVFEVKKYDHVKTFSEIVPPKKIVIQPQVSDESCICCVIF